MLRSLSTRPLVKGLIKASFARSSHTVAASTLKIVAASRPLTARRPQALVPTPNRLGTISLLRYATVTKGREEVLESHPGDVSTGSSVRHVFEGKADEQDDKDADMLGGIRGDIETIKDTFRLSDVPRESFYLGAAGVLPYLATSISTVYLTWDINHAHAHGTGVFLSADTAHQLLAILEPIQIGYGAVIISFLGAIHWGLEYAGYGGHQGYKRYAIGVIAPAVAWPTMLMPVEYALITQFLAFNFLYFADARATVRGWAPPWYSTYRFVLTFFVGASIVISLIGHGKVISKDGRLPGPAERMKALRDSQMESLEREERERRKQIVEADEGEESDE